MELKHPYKSDIIYMIGSWRVALTYTIAFYTYQSTFLSKKLNVEEKLTLQPSPTVLCAPTALRPRALQDAPAPTDPNS